MNRNILRLAIPNIISNLTVPLLTIVDLHLMGYLDSATYMGAVALGGTIFNLVYWGFGFLRMSTGGLTAQSYGAGDKQESATILSRGLLITLFGSFFLLSLQVPIEKLSFFILSGSDEVTELARNYFYVRIWAVPAAIGMMVLNGWFIGMQNSKYPMITSVVINVVNIAVSIYFVRVLGWEEKGVAAGSVIAQYVGIILSLFLLNKKYHEFLPLISIKKSLNLLELKRYMAISSNIFVRTVCMVTVFTFFTSASASFGDIALASNTALLQYLMLFSYFLDGFAYAAEAITGKFIGAKMKERLIESTNKLMLWGVGFGVSFSMVYFFMGDKLMYVFTDEPDVIEYADNFLNWVIILPVISFSSYIWDGIFIGATASKSMRNSAIISTLVFFGIYYLLLTKIGNNALWLSMTLFMAVRGITLTVMSKKAIFSR